MQRIFLALVIIALVANVSFAEVIGPELQEAMKNARGKLNVMITLKKDFDVKELVQNYRINGKKQIFEVLKSECETNQHFLNSLCERMVADSRVQNVKKFWLANAIALQADSSAIKELAAQIDDVASIVLDAEQQMIDPIKATDTNARRSLWGLAHIKSDKANQQGHTGQGVTVAVVDTGIDTDHSAFSAGQVLVNECSSFVPGEPTVEDGNGHGTHCAGTVAGHTYGVAPDAKLIGIKVLSARGSGSWNGVMQGVQDGATKADILSMSLGGRASSSGNVVESAVKNAINAGVVLIIAAGNSGPWGRTIGTPGVVKEAITVGAIDIRGNLARFSSRGPTVYGDEKPDVSAPGVNVLSAWMRGGTRTISGTSMATPHVAGLAALLLSKNPNLSPQQVKNVLMSTCGGQKGPNQFGAGVVDSLKALARAN